MKLRTVAFWGVGDLNQEENKANNAHGIIAHTVLPRSHQGELPHVHFRACLKAPGAHP